MRCCIEWFTLLWPVLVVQPTGPVPSPGDLPAPPARIDPSELDPRVRQAGSILAALEDGGVLPTPEQWAVVCEACGLHPTVRELAARSNPFPASVTAALLVHPSFAVRTGALEILEERSGKESAFDPWQPGAEPSTTAFREWKAWAEWYDTGRKPDDPDQGSQEPAVPDEAKMRAYLVEIIGADVTKRERAFQALARVGMPAVAFLEQYLHDTPQIGPGERARIKEMQYRLVIAPSLPDLAGSLARDLVFGTRDQKLAAMQPLPRCRDRAVPILAEFLPDGDALVREAAMDALILAGGDAVHPLIQEHLRTETDENVIHAVLRRVSPATPRGAGLIAGFLAAENEDLVVAALNALADGRSAAGTAEVARCIADPRWRVRVAALEYAGKVKVKEDAAEGAILAAFQDEDEFVRYAAMKAAADLGLEKAIPLVTRMALEDDSMLGPATDAIVRMGRLLPPDLVKALPDKPGESVLAVLGAFGGRAGRDGSTIQWNLLQEGNSGSESRKERAAALQALEIVRAMAGHPDPDVRALAIQILAGILPALEDKRRVFAALETADDPGKIAILESMAPGLFDFSVPEREPAGTSGPDGGTEDPFARVLREPAPRNPDLEAVYAAFGVPVEGASGPGQGGTGAPGERVWPPMDKEFHDFLVAQMKRRDAPEVSFHAALPLAYGGQPEAVAELLRRLPGLEAHQRARLADEVSRAPRLTRMASGRELLRALLQDESPETRVEAVYAALSDRDSDLIRLVLAETGRADGHLKAVNVYGYSLVNASDRTAPRQVIQSWCRETLGQPEAREDAKTLALVLLGTSASKAESTDLVRTALDATSVWQRRAAWRSLQRLDAVAFEQTAAKLADDPSPLVREALAAAYLKSGGESEWRVWFGERDWEEETVPHRQRARAYGIPEGLAPALERLSRDPSVPVRAMALLTLLGHGKDVDPLALRETVAALDETERRGLLRPFLAESYNRLSPRFGFLLDHVEQKWFGADEWESMTSRLGGGAGGAGSSVATFASLVRASSGDAPAAPEPSTGEDPPPRGAAGEGKAVRVLFFHKPGCQECERVRDMLRDLAADRPLEVDEHNIETRDGAERNEVLCARFRVDPASYQLTPAVFTGAGALVKEAVTYNALQRLIEQAAEAGPDDAWHLVGEEEQSRAGAEIAGRFGSFSVGWVALAGLLDGINPCAFATIIFFLSYLRIARRTPREILLVGGAFVSAVFLAYFTVGLGFSQVVTQLEGVSWMRVWLNRVLGVVALLLAWLSFRDGVLALRGRAGDSALQLPDFLKDRIRSVIRGQARNSHFVAAAFVSGIVISFLELACTGQVYLPTIIYMVKQGSLTATGYLLLYNLAFILPLVVIFVLAWLGLTSAMLIEFQKKHTATVRFATGLLFLSLWVVLLLA